MLGLAGIPATAGFFGKFYLIDAAVSGSYTWLGVVIVIGSMISLGYYLPVVSAMWMREAPAGTGPRTAAPLPALAGGSPELDEEAPSAAERRAGPDSGTGGGTRAHPEVVLVALIAGAGTIFFGILPQPLFELVRHTGTALGLL
jgi:NADH-quinone oxidoreductase subunit N